MFDDFAAAFSYAALMRQQAKYQAALQQRNQQIQEMERRHRDAQEGIIEGTFTVVDEPKLLEGK